MKIALVSKKNRWFEQILSSLHSEHTVIPIHHKEDLETSLSTHSPDWVFVFHWSYIIDKSIYSKYKCVSFHTGNLPNDRGGCFWFRNESTNDNSNTWYKLGYLER